VSQATDNDINSFLELFEGSPVKAVLAIRDYAAAHPTQPTVGTQPTAAVTQPAAVPLQPTTSEPTGPVLVSLKDVTKMYRAGKTKVEALRGVSLAVRTGEIVAITGPSGSGKSTLLQLIGCLDRPTTGTVQVDGRDIATLRDAALSDVRRATIGFIFQSFYLQPFLSLHDNVAVPAMFTGQEGKAITTRTAALLGTVGLADRATHFPKELSGGQIQRAAIARALMNRPKLLLADEPTGNLDSANSERIMALFRSIRDTLGTTVVIVTHNPEIARAADRIIQLKDGAIV